MIARTMGRLRRTRKAMKTDIKSELILREEAPR